MANQLLIPESWKPGTKPIDRWAKSARAIGSFGAVLFAYDSEGKELVGIPCKPKSLIDWARQGVTKADKTRLAQALQELA